MSKRKLLIQKVFEHVQKSSEKDTKSGWAGDIADYLDEHLGFMISKRTLIRYYEAYIERNEEIDIEFVILNKLSQYLDYRDYNDFISTIEKRGENASITTVQVDNNEVASVNGTTGLSVIINNSNSNNNNNDQHFNVPDFIKKNGMGILEMTFVILLATGGVVFSNPKNANRLGIMSGLNSPATYKPFMYWDKDRYIATDSSYLGPQIEVVPMDSGNFTYLKKITRPDTLTVDNALHKVWYDKSANEVEFFTSFGKHPENGKTLKEATPYIISTYGGE